MEQLSLHATPREPRATTRESLRAMVKTQHSQNKNNSSMVWGVRYAEVNCITAIVQSVEGRGRASCKALTLCVGLYDIT